TVLTCLGENIKDACEAAKVTNHYLMVLDRICEAGLETEISVKLSHMGLDLGKNLCYSNFTQLIERAGQKSMVWIDMESSPYVDCTLEIFHRARREYPNVGVCVQAYLHRTAEDLEALVAMGAAVRLVKGAYREPPDVAIQRKKDIDENYFTLAQRMLSREARAAGMRAAIGTHDPRLIRRIQEWALANQIPKDGHFEFQMLFGIQRKLQLQLAQEGWKSVVLIAYGDYWFPWFMRRLAERPANALHVVRNLF
ncbi:MAG: proline dehydrogenase family protein, partial [Acidobacteria bacterium]|nr:proline dehydrogenase family protein [Acidobacteriota bacterium]